MTIPLTKLKMEVKGLLEGEVQTTAQHGKLTPWPKKRKKEKKKVTETKRQAGVVRYIFIVVQSGKMRENS